MSRLPERLPAALSERITSASQTVYNRQGREVDVAIGGIPFRLATSTDYTQRLETISARKDQFDAENDPGEQSLTGWWRRSQSSFHEGAGYRYQEGADASIAPATFWDSRGVNVFGEQGKITLLHKAEASVVASGTYTKQVAAVSRSGSTLTWTLGYVKDGNFVVGSATHNPTGDVVDAVLAGPSVFYDITDAGTFYKGVVSGASITESYWPLGATPTRVTVGHHRPWVLGGNKIWQPNMSDLINTTQDPIFESPDTSWVYSCAAEGPSGMYFAGSNGYHSTIQIITLDGSGGLPTLSGATNVAILPAGEVVTELAVLGGQYLGIGTTKGFRMGLIDTNGSVTYGPLMIEDKGVCTALVAQGRFFVAAFSDENVCWRIDTATQVTDGVFAYAADVEAPVSGAISSLADYNGALVGTCNGTAWVESEDFVDSGWIETGRIRFRTTEPKSFKYVNLEIEPLDGAIAVELVQEGGGTAALGAVSEQGAIFQDKFSVDLPAMRYASLKFTLTPDETNEAAPVLRSYLLRALPAVTPQRLITLPLLCYDQERARSGQRYGGTGFAKDRLQALQVLEDSAETLIYQDFSSTSGVGQRVVIEGMRFTQTSPAPPFKSEGAGGVLEIQLRTVD